VCNMSHVPAGLVGVRLLAHVYGVLQSYSDCITGGLSTRQVHVALVSVFWRLHAIVECLQIMDPVMWWQIGCPVSCVNTCIRNYLLCDLVVVLIALLMYQSGVRMSPVSVLQHDLMVHYSGGPMHILVCLPIVEHVTDCLLPIMSITTCCVIS